MALQPYGFRILVEQTSDDEMTESGLYIPGNSSKTTAKGRVVALGKGELSDNGLEIGFPFAVGDTVLFDPLGPIEVTDAGKKLFLVPGKNVYAWIAK